MAAALTEDGFHVCFEVSQHFHRHKGLCGTGKAAAVHAHGTLALQVMLVFPNTPEKIVNTNNGIRSTIYQTKDLTCVFGIVCSDMSSKKIRITSEYAQILYEELKKEDFNASIEHRDINEDIHKGVKKL